MGANTKEGGNVIDVELSPHKSAVGPSFGSALAVPEGAPILFYFLCCIFIHFHHFWPRQKYGPEGI